MKGLRPALLLLSVMFALGGLVHGASSDALLLPPASRVEIRLPMQLAELAIEAPITSPQVLSLKRDLELARSKHRANMVGVNGATVTFDVPVQADGQGVGGGASLSLKRTSGDTVAQASVGGAAAYRWGDQSAVAPALGLEVRHTLFGGQAVAVLRYDHQLAQAEATFNKGLRSWTVDLIKAYSAAQLAVLDVQIASARHQVALARLAAVSDREAEGAASASELYGAHHTVTLADLALDSARFNADLALQALQQLTGTTVTVAGLPEATSLLHWPDGPGGDQGAWVSYAMASRLDLQLAHAAVVLAEAELYDAKRHTGLAGELRAGLAYPAKADKNDPAVGWYVGAGFALPLHDRTRSEAVVQAQLKLEQAVADQLGLMAHVQAEVEAAYRQHELALRHYERSVADAQHAANLSQVAHASVDAGLGTESDLADAAIRYAEAERAVLAAFYDVALKRTNLWHVVGRDVAW